MAASVDTVISEFKEIKKSLETVNAEKADLKSKLEKSDAKLADLEKSNGEIKKSYDDLMKGLNSTPDYGDNPPFPVFARVKNQAEELRMGFKSFSHYVHDVMEAGRPGGRPSECFKSFMNKAPSGLNETVGTEGGFLVPPAFSSEIWQRTYTNSLWEMTTGHTAGANTNSLTFNGIDETSRANGSRFGGVRAYWEAEANQATTTKPAYFQMRLMLHRLLAISYATDELMADSGTALEQHLFNLFSSEVKFKLGDALINGTGAGMPQGVLNSAALISVSKETGQGAATILKENIDKMWSRMWAPSRATAVWLINQDIEPALFSMALNVGTGGMPAYMPPGGMSDSPYGRLLGRPVIPTEFNATLGTVGDILFVDLKQVYSLRKGETAQDTSIHLRFDYAETAFRTIFRADARTIWNAPLTPFKGSATKSPLIALATRA